jgi:hypothetical protein
MVKKKIKNIKIYKALAKYDHPGDINTFDLASKLGTTQQAIAGCNRAAQANNSKIGQMMQRRKLKPGRWFGNLRQIDNAEPTAQRSNIAETQQTSAQSVKYASPGTGYPPTPYPSNTLARNYRSTPLSARSPPFSASSHTIHYDAYTGNRYVNTVPAREPTIQDQLLSWMEYRMTMDFIEDTRKRRRLEREERRIKNQMLYNQNQVPQWQIQQLIQYFEAQNQANMFIIFSYFTQMFQGFLSGMVNVLQEFTSNPSSGPKDAWMN